MIGKNLISKIECAAPSSSECDIRNFQNVQDIIASIRPTIVINLSGQSNTEKCSSDDAYQINVNGVTNICYALAKHCKGSFLFQAGSINQILRPHEDYSQQKVKAESICNGYSRVLDVCTARLCTVEGGYREGFIVSDIVRITKEYIRSGKSFVINDMGARKWSLDVDSATDAIIKACESRLTGAIYIGPTIHYSVEEIFCEICTQFGLSVVKVGGVWTDVNNGSAVMKSRHESKDVKTLDFGKPSGKLTTNLSKIVKTIILSS
jgi:nucleoside-diphosphate-sugar epimerase